jgi:hypothetical protein
MRTMLRLLFLFFISDVSGISNTADSSKPLEINHTLFYSKKDVPQANLSDKELEKLEEGDFLLRKGYGWISDRIADLLDEEYRITHCGMILTQGYSEPHVLHSVSDDRVNGIFVEPLKAFIKDSQNGSLIAVRLKNPCVETREIVLESKRLLAKKVPFDLAFNDADSSSFYCAELFGYVFNNICKKDLLPEKVNLFGMKAIRMRNFLNPEEFKIIFNQFEYKK